MRRRLLPFLLLALPAIWSGCSWFGGGGYATVYEQRCDDPSCLDDFVVTDASMWRMGSDGEAPAMELLGKSDYRPPHRSPHSIALIENVEVRDFDLDVDLQQTGEEGAHRDLCLFFGFQSKSRYYYTHLAPKPDPNAHNVFVVNDAPRKNLIDPPVDGVDWGRGAWHHVHIERRVDEGTIKIFWDDAEQPILVANDATFDWGRVGFGSFDNEGLVRNIVLRAPTYRFAEGNPFR